MSIKLKIKKIDKDKVGYLNEKGCDYTCRECYFYKEKKCAMYGENVEIDPMASCILWQKADNSHEKSWIATTTKQATSYEISKDGFSCARCEYFNSSSGMCKKVKGHIDSTACCNLWEANDE
jgi:hypothetical protein